MRVVDRISTLAFIWIALSFHGAFCQQVEYGIIAGAVIPSSGGFNKIDSIGVLMLESQNSSSVGYGGIYFKTNISPSFALKGQVGLFQNSANFLVYNYDQVCTFCPVEKGALIVFPTIFFEPELLLRVWGRSQFTLSVAIGTAIHFQIKKAQPDISFNGKHQGVATVINALDETPKPVVPYYTLGLLAKYKRFGFTMKKIENFSNSYLGDITVYGKSYPFTYSSSFVTIGLSFKLNKLLSGNESDVK